MYCADYCLGKKALLDNRKSFSMQDLLLYLDLPCRSIIRLLLYLDLACTLITPIHQKDLDRILPVYVIKTVHIYYLLLSPSINVDLCHHIDS